MTSLHHDIKFVNIRDKLKYSKYPNQILKLICILKCGAYTRSIYNLNITKMFNFLYYLLYSSVKSKEFSPSNKLMK